MDGVDLSLRDLISASQYDDYYLTPLFYLFDLQTGPANTQESECVNQTSFNRVVLDRLSLWFYLVITKYAPILLNQSAQLVKSVTDFYQKQTLTMSY